MAKVFVSYRNEDQNFRGDFAGLLGGNHESNDIPVIDRKNFRGTNKDKELREYLNSQVNQCSAFALLLGANTHNGGWVDHEINVALSGQLKIFAVRIPNTTGGLPSKLKNKSINIVEWDGVKVQDEIDRLFGRLKK